MTLLVFSWGSRRGQEKGRALGVLGVSLALSASWSFLFLVVEDLLVGSNPGCIFRLWVIHYIAIKFATIPAFIVA